MQGHLFKRRMLALGVGATVVSLLFLAYALNFPTGIAGTTTSESSDGTAARYVLAPIGILSGAVVALLGFGAFSALCTWRRLQENASP